jgi:hypothetical protein
MLLLLPPQHATAGWFTDFVVNSQLHSFSVLAITGGWLRSSRHSGSTPLSGQRLFPAADMYGPTALSWFM